MQQRNVWSFTLVLIGLVFIINVFARDLFIRFDLTENKRYSISDVTKDVLSRIEDPVTVKIYYSENFPRQLISVKQYVLDMLNEYRAYAGASLEYEFISMSGEDQELEQEALSYGVQPVQANITESDEIKVQRIYLGIVFLYEDKRETIPFAQRIDQLEYDMTGAIKKLLATQPPKIGWLTGNGEPALYGNQEMAQSLEQIRKNYELVEVNLETEERVPLDLNVLLIVDTKDNLTDAELYKLDQFILSGGRLGVFLNTKTVDMENQYMPLMDNYSNIFDFFEHHGVRIGKNLLLDRSSYQVQAMQNLGIIQIPIAVEYPLAPRITDLNAENPIVNRLTEVGFFFANELNPSDTTVQFTSLLRTSEKTGYAQPDPRTRMINISASQEYPDYLFNQGPKTVAAVVETRGTSYFGASRPDTLSYPAEHLTLAAQPARMVVAGSSTFTKGQFMIPATLTFFLNTVDWLYDENGLISIRSKNIQPSQIDPELKAGTKQLLKWLNILLAPVIIVLGGVIRWQIRKRSKRLAGGQA